MDNITEELWCDGEYFYKPHRTKNVVGGYIFLKRFGDDSFELVKWNWPDPNSKYHPATKKEKIKWKLKYGF